MFCPKFTQLSPHYEAALRLVARVEESLDKTDLADATRRVGLEVEKKAVDEKNAVTPRWLFTNEAVRSAFKKHDGADDC
jgi:hypothetical protein